MNREQLLAEATEIADAICQHQLRTSGGNIAWIGPVGYRTELSPLRVVQLGPQLFDGTTGIALFLAATGRLTGRTQYIDSALESIAPLRRKLAELVENPERTEGLRLAVGGLIGIGSFVYGLLKIGEFSAAPELAEEAHRATALITEQRIGWDQHVRVQAGSAGAILALLALQDRLSTPNPAGTTPLDLSLACARHLLEVRTSCNSMPRAWALSPGKPPLIGFSYGAAGVSYALLRLYAVSHQTNFREAAEEGLAFIHDHYVPERQSWCDSRSLFQRQFQLPRGTWKDWWAAGSLSDLQPKAGEGGLEQAKDESQSLDSGEDCFFDMWCHGASGIVLGQIGAQGINGGTQLLAESATVLERLRREALENDLHPGGSDDLCCGHMGRIETLLSAYRRLHDERCRDAAHAMMDRVCHRARERGRYELSAARGTDVFAPALFQGVAGVGYTLLRLAAPDELPSLLLFE